MKNTKKFFAGFLMILMISCFVFSASAAEMTSGDYTFTRINTENGIRITSYTGNETEVVIPETIDGYTVESIYEVSGIFADDSGVVSVSVPETVTEIYGGSFLCKTLKEIKVDENNSSYESVDGVLYTEDMKTLVSYPAAKEGTTYTVPFGVEKIDRSAFRYNTILNEVVLPPNLTTIDYYAFWGCSGLKKMTLPYEISYIGTWVFNGCTDLYLVVPAGISDIENFASKLVTFNDSDGFVKCIVVPKSDLYTAIETKLKEENLYNIWESGVGTHSTTYGYNWVGSLKFTVYNRQAILSDVDENAEGTVYVPSSAFGYPVTSIFDKAFENCNKITQLHLPDTVTEVTSGALEGLENVEKITVSKNLSTASYMFSKLPKITSFEAPSGLKKIPYALFSNSNIKSVILNDDLETIGKDAFSYTKITEITIPAGVKEIVSGAFSGTTSLKEFKVAAENENYCSVDGVLYTKDMKTLVAYPIQKTDEKYVVPETVTAVLDSAFAENSYLKEVVLPENLEKLGEAAFNVCVNLEKVNIPSKIKVIEAYTFGACSKIKSIELPDGLEAIEEAAFYGSYYITSVKIPESCKKIGAYAFADCFSLKEIRIPAGTVTVEACAFDYCISLSQLELLSIESSYIPFVNTICCEIPENFDLNAYITCRIEYEDLLEKLLFKEYGDLTMNELMELLNAKEEELDAFGLDIDKTDYSRLNITAHYDSDLAQYAAENGVNYNILPHNFTYVWMTEVDEETGETVVYEANCENYGWATSVTCDVCGLVGEIVHVAPLHKPVTLNAKPATCTQAGFTGDIACELCKVEIMKGKEIAPINHANAELQNEAQASCAKDGYTGDTYCPDCKTTIKTGQTIPATGEHKEFVIKNDKEATYEADGYTGDKHCKECDTLIENGTTIPKLEKPTEPDIPAEPGEECDHLCHKDGFLGFIWKIVSFFQKLFKINPVCECGVSHY